MAPRLPYFIIESKRPHYTVIDMKGNPDFAQLKKDEAARTLPAVPMGKVVKNRAEIHASTEMLIETYYDKPGGVENFRFREDVIVAQADERGRIFIDKDQPDLARRILREVRVLDPTVLLDRSGEVLEEERSDEERSIEKPRNVGGRPRRPS